MKTQSIKRDLKITSSTAVSGYGREAPVSLQAIPTALIAGSMPMEMEPGRPAVSRLRWDKRMSPENLDIIGGMTGQLPRLLPVR
jgi:hypothetical protein